MEEVGQARAEANAAFVGGRRLSGGSNERRKWAQAEEVSIGLRAEAIHLSGGDGGGRRGGRWPRRSGGKAAGGGGEYRAAGGDDKQGKQRWRRRQTGAG